MYINDSLSNWKQEREELAAMCVSSQLYQLNTSLKQEAVVWHYKPLYIHKNNYFQSGFLCVCAF